MNVWPFHGNPSLHLGSYGFGPLRRSVTIPADKAKTHMHVIGLSGNGKSNFLAGLFLSMQRLGLAATLIDPHGDLARLVVANLVYSGLYDDPMAFERIIYLDLPAGERRERFVPFNVLKQHAPPHTIGTNTLDAFHRAYPELAEGAAAFNNLVKFGVKILISNDLPLTMFRKFLTNEAYRRSLYEKEGDRDTVEYFAEFFDKMSEHDRNDEIKSSMRRLGHLTYNPLMRYSLSTSDNLFNFREIFDRGTSLIVNLAVSDAEARRLLGCLLTVNAEFGALSRSDVATGQRGRSHHLILDEFHQFSSQSERALASMLSQCRKFGLHLVLSHQTWDQTNRHLQGALQNVRIEAVFGLGHDDATYSAPILGKIDPLQVKHGIAHEERRDDTHPVFYSPLEQRETFVDELRDLRPGQAYLHLALPDTRPWLWRLLFPSSVRRVVKVKTPYISDPKVNASTLARVEDTYLRRYFRSKESIDGDMARRRSVDEPRDLTTRTRVRSARPAAVGSS